LATRKKDKNTEETPKVGIEVNKRMTEELMAIVIRYKEDLGETVTESARVCSVCKKNKALNHFFTGRNPLFHNGRIGVCKECIEEYVNFSEYGEVQYFLTLMGLPFVEDIWEKCLEDPSPIGKYVKLMNLGQYSKLEAATINRIKSYSEELENDPYQAQLDLLTNEERGYLKAKWGESYSLIDCIKLEEYTTAMMQDYKIDTKSHQDYLQKIAKVSLIIDEMIVEKDYDGVKKMSKTLDDLMKSAGFTQNTKSKNGDDENYNSWALLFEIAEKQGFIPKYHTDEPKDIVDKTIQNLRNWTYQLIAKEPDLQQLLENAAKRVIEQEKKEHKDELPAEDNYADIK
jgi:hypothetical protein